MRMLWFLTLVIAGSSAQDPGQDDWVPASASSSDEVFSIERGGGAPSLLIQSDEELSYLVEIDIGPFRGIEVGEARFKSWVEGEGEAAVGHLEARFNAQHLGYRLLHELRSEHFLSGDVQLKYSDTQRGSENRRRELRIERGGEGPKAVYRFDGHCGGCKDKAHFVDPLLPWKKPIHCKKCKGLEHRLWREPRTRAVPADTLEFLSSIYLIRGLVLGGLEELETPMLDKDKLWSLTLRRGQLKEIEVPKGRYVCRKIIIDAEKPASESHKSDFSGLFGMEGSMNFWVHESTGVLVEISGELPFGLSVKIRLKDAKGAPEGLAPKGG